MLVYHMTSCTIHQLLAHVNLQEARSKKFFAHLFAATAARAAFTTSITAMPYRSSKAA